jgi:hypothetical protein
MTLCDRPFIVAATATTKLPITIPGADRRCAQLEQRGCKPDLSGEGHPPIVTAAGARMARRM